MTEERPVYLYVPNVPARPSAEPYVVHGNGSAVQKSLSQVSGGVCGLSLAQALGSLLRSLDCCNTDAEIVIRPRNRGDAQNHRVTIHDPQHFGLEVGEGDGGEE